MPLGELPDRLGELDGHHEIVTHCHHGARSLKALEILKAAGFAKVRSQRGGVDAWAVNVDSSLPRDLRHLAKAGLGPPRAVAHWLLNPARLPVPPPRRIRATANLSAG